MNLGEEQRAIERRSEAIDTEDLWARIRVDLDLRDRRRPHGRDRQLPGPHGPERPVRLHDATAARV